MSCMSCHVLASFKKRALPLVDSEFQQREAEAEFNKKWDAGEIEGWEEARQTKSAANSEGNGEGIWCAACEFYDYTRNIVT